jgi:hypothetical protein
VPPRAPMTCSAQPERVFGEPRDGRRHGRLVAVERAFGGQRGDAGGARAEHASG